MVRLASLGLPMVAALLRCPPPRRSEEDSDRTKDIGPRQ